MVRRCVPWMAALVVAVVASNAAADGKDPAAADALFREGREAMKRGDYAAACPRFAESQRLDPAGGTVLNLAECESKMGRLASAWQHYQEAADTLPAGDPRRDHAKAQAAALDKRLPRLVVRLQPDAPAGTKVQRDGVEWSSVALGSALPVDPGRHVITVTSPGHADSRIEVILSEAERKELSVTAGAVLDTGDKRGLGAQADAPAASTNATRADATSRGSGGRTWAYVAGGVGAAGLVVATISGLMLMSKNKTIDSHCDADKTCDDAGLDAASGAKGLVPINTVSWVVAVAGIGTGTYLFLTSGPSEKATTGTPTTGLGLRWGGVF